MITCITAEDIRNAKSAGHIAFYQGSDGSYELYREFNGNLYTAHRSVCIDASTGNRMGRYYCPAPAADFFISTLRPFFVAA